MTRAAEEETFAGVRWHGNTSRRAVDSVGPAVTWVWSNAATLAGAFSGARRRSWHAVGRPAGGTCQGPLEAPVRRTAERGHSFLTRAGADVRLPKLGAARERADAVSFKDAPSAGEPVIVAAARKHQAVLRAYFSIAA